MNRVGTGANVFYRAGIIEKWGTGTLNIIEWCKENGNSMPQWSVRAGSVVLTFKPMRDKIARRPESQFKSQFKSQSKSLREIVVQLLEKEPLSATEMSQSLGQKRVSGQLKNILRNLIKEGVVAHTIPEKPKSRLQKYMLTKKQ